MKAVNLSCEKRCGWGCEERDGGGFRGVRRKHEIKSEGRENLNYFSLNVPFFP